MFCRTQHIEISGFHRIYCVRRATVYWAIAIILYSAQLTLIVNDIWVPYAYEMLYDIGLVVLGIAGFQTGLFVYFTFFPNAKKPRVSLTWIFTTVILVGLDYVYASLLKFGYSEWAFESGSGNLSSAGFWC
jgi:hypothetical protein